MFKDQLLLMIRFKHDAVFIKSTYASGKLHTACEIDDCGLALFSGSVQKGVLKILARYSSMLPQIGLLCHRKKL